MTEKQITEAARAFHETCKDHLDNLSMEEELTCAEFPCRRMMNSFFAYEGIPSLYDEDSWSFKRYLQEYLDKLGRERFDRVREEQVATYKQCTVSVGTYTDNDGLTYNSINWCD